MADKLIYILNDDTKYFYFLDYNYWLKRLDTELNEPINQIYIKVPKVVKPMNKKTLFYYTTLGD